MARTALPSTAKQAALPLEDPEVIEVEAADQIGDEMLEAETEADACHDADELHEALLAFAEAPEEEAIRQ